MKMRAIRVILCLLQVCLAAQEPSTRSPTPEPSGQPPAAPSIGGGVSAKQLANANNPLADADALNFQNYYTPSVYGVSSVNSNTMNIRGVIVSGRQIIPCDTAGFYSARRPRHD
jgi:hypothetical protein